MKFRTLSSSQSNTILVIGVIIFVLLLLVIIIIVIIVIIIIIIIMTKACNLKKYDGSWLYHGWSVHATGHRQGAQGGAWRCVCFFVLSRFEVMWSSHQDHFCFWWILQNRSNANMFSLHHQVFPGCHCLDFLGFLCDWKSQGSSYVSCASWWWPVFYGLHGAVCRCLQRPRGRKKQGRQTSVKGDSIWHTLDWKPTWGNG